LHAILRALAEKDGRIPIDVVIRIIIDVLTGLDAAHELLGPNGEPLHLVHRDVSPANILAGTDGISRITDFGIARAAWRLSTTRDGQVKGKVAYMPPEQICGDPVDRRCDVYATGVVLWQALVGHRPFQANNDGALVHEVISGVSKSPRQLVATVPGAIDRVCMQALALSPDERYATASDFAEALEQAAIDNSIPIATSRAVGAFVKRLEIHTPTTDLVTGVRPSSPPGSPPDSGPAISTDGIEPASSTQITNTAATITTTLAVSHRRSRIGLVIGAVAAVSLGGLAGAYVFSSQSNKDATPTQPKQGAQAGPTTRLTATTATISAATAPDASASKSRTIASTEDAGNTPPTASAAGTNTNSKPWMNKPPKLPAGSGKTPAVPKPESSSTHSLPRTL